MSKFNRFSIANHTNESPQSFDSLPFTANEFEYQSHEHADERQRSVIELGKEAVRLAVESQQDVESYHAREQSSTIHERQRPLRPANSHEQIMNDPALRELYGAQEQVGEFAGEAGQEEAIMAREYSEKIVQDLENDDPALHTLLSTMYGGEPRDIVENLAIDTEGRLLVAAYLSDKLRFLTDDERIPKQAIHANVRGSLEALSGGMTPPAAAVYVS